MPRHNPDFAPQHKKSTRTRAVPRARVLKNRYVAALAGFT